jgi:hypothetical protein
MKCFTRNYLLERGRGSESERERERERERLELRFTIYDLRFTIHNSRFRNIKTYVANLAKWLSPELENKRRNYE